MNRTPGAAGSTGPGTQTHSPDSISDSARALSQARPLPGSCRTTVFGLERPGLPAPGANEQLGLVGPVALDAELADSPGCWGRGAGSTPGCRSGERSKEMPAPQRQDSSRTELQSGRASQAWCPGGLPGGRGRAQERHTRGAGLESQSRPGPPCWTTGQHGHHDEASQALGSRIAEEGHHPRGPRTADSCLQGGPAWRRSPGRVF